MNKKNLFIVILVAVVGIMGYLLYTKNSDPGTKTSSDPATSNSVTNEINLTSKNLDKISVDILNNSSATKLNVSNNNLTGALPSQIQKLTSLDTLLASNNELTGIPAEIGQLSKLRFVDFSNNDISGLPFEIGKLKNLETLDLRGNPNISMRDIGLIQKEIPNAKILTD